MLAIRLARTGRNKYPTYRIVAAESSRATTGKFVAILGHYNPHTKELVIKKEETVKLLSHGAQPSNTVVKLLQRQEIDLPKWVQLVTKNKKSKQAAVETKPAAEAETATEEAVAEDVSAEPAEATADEERVATSAEENAEKVAENTSETAPEDTAGGEEAQADTAKTEAAGDAAVEAAKDETDSQA